MFNEVSSTGIALIITAVGTLIGVLTTSVISILTVIATRKEVERNTVLTHEVNLKAEAIGVKVDGAASASKAEIIALKDQLELLRSVIAEKKETAALLAQAAATGVAVGPAIIAQGETQDSHLQSIDKNTAETATNTARTEVATDSIIKNQINDKLDRAEKEASE